jgi:hypothetical protein
MSDLDEIGKKPDRFEQHDENPKGIKLFFGDKERQMFSEWGREISEEILLESFLLYRIDKTKTKTHKLYGESKRKVYKPEIEIYGRLNVEVNDTEFYIPGGGITKKGMGMFSAHIYLEHLEEIGLVDKKNDNNLVLDFKLGDFVGFKGQFYKIIDDGYSQISNKYSWAG